MTVEVATSSVYRCDQCGQTFSKVGKGAMGAFKNHLNKHPSNRMFKILAGANPNPNSNPNLRKELEKE
jgi:hypothetical protein